jgi:hypothetical protein
MSPIVSHVFYSESCLISHGKMRRDTAVFYTGVTIDYLDQLSMLQVMKAMASKNYHAYCKKNKLFDFRLYDLDEDGHINKKEFESCVTCIVQQHAFDISSLWTQLAGENALMSRDEFLRLKHIPYIPSVVGKDGRRRLSDAADAVDVGQFTMGDGDAVEQTLGFELKKAALTVVEAWVDEENIDVKYGVDEDTALITAAAQGDDAEVRRL